MIAATSSESATVERPAWRVSFRTLMLIVLGISVVAVVAGRYVFVRYGGYRPLALSHVPQTMRYRARIETGDQARMEAIAPLLTALDPRHVRLPAIEKRLGMSARQVVREVAFGAGPNPPDFVVVLGLKLQSETGLPPAKAICEALSSDGIHPEPTETGCRFGEAIVASTEEGAVVVASDERLVKGLLGTPDLGDRLGFSGPSVRGIAPKVDELGREATLLAQRLLSQYP
jgi:hypothetical protein